MRLESEYVCNTRVWLKSTDFFRIDKYQFHGKTPLLCVTIVLLKFFDIVQIDITLNII